MASDNALLNRLLEIEPPWTVRDCQWSSSGKRVELSIGVPLPRNWFGQAKPPGNESVRRWRHVNIGGAQCHVSAYLPRGLALGTQPWAANGNTGFSYAMSKQIFAMLSEGIEYAAICNLLEIPFQELWKFKFALDSGKANVEQPAAPAAAAPVRQPAAPTVASPVRQPAAAQPAAVAQPELQAAVASLVDIAVGDAVPDVTDPVWQELAEGRVSLDIRMLSLKLLLTRVRSQMEVIHDSEVRLSKLRELHRYFLKNERMLGHEIAQLHSFR